MTDEEKLQLWHVLHAMAEEIKHLGTSKHTCLPKESAERLCDDVQTLYGTMFPDGFDEAAPGGLCHLGHDWRDLETTAGYRCERCGVVVFTTIRTDGTNPLEIVSTPPWKPVVDEHGNMDAFEAFMRGATKRQVEEHGRSHLQKDKP